MGTGTWDAEAMDIISAGAAATGTTTVGATTTGTTAGGGVTDTIIVGITGTIIAGGSPSEKGRPVGGPFFTTFSERGNGARPHERSMPTPPGLERSFPPGWDGQIGQQLHLAAAARHGIEHQP
jgi:hypothetical protein